MHCASTCLGQCLSHMDPTAQPVQCDASPDSEHDCCFRQKQEQPVSELAHSLCRTSDDGEAALPGGRRAIGGGSGRCASQEPQEASAAVTRAAGRGSVSPAARAASRRIRSKADTATACWCAPSHGSVCVLSISAEPAQGPAQSQAQISEQHRSSLSQAHPRWPQTNTQHPCRHQTRRQ